MGGLEGRRVIGVWKVSAGGLEVRPRHERILRNGLVRRAEQAHYHNEYCKYSCRHRVMFLSLRDYDPSVEVEGNLTNTSHVLASLNGLSLNVYG